MFELLVQGRIRININSIQFNSIQFNSMLLSISGKLFCLHAYIEYIGTYIEYILTRHRFDI